MRVRIIVRPTGLLNGQEWPAVGQTIDLPKVVAEGMAEAGDVEVVVEKASEKPAEKRPERQAAVEKRAEKKS